jgi:molybdate transport repressor ModE-like protein
MDSRRLRYFVQIVDHGSITRAAAAAGVAQPALSQQLAILENEVKVKLLERSATGVTPTTAGRVLYARAQAILRQYEELRLAVHREVQPLSGTVVIGISPTMMQRLGWPLIETVCHQHPEMQLQLMEDGSAVLQQLLATGRIELAVSALRPDGEMIVGEELLRETLHLVYPAAWTLLPTAPLSELAQLPWIVTRQPHSIRTLVDAVFAANGFAPRIVVEIDSLHTVIEMVRRNLGVTVLPEASVSADVSTGSLRTLPFSGANVARAMFLSQRRTAELSPAAHFVRERLREIAAGL